MVVLFLLAVPLLRGWDQEDIGWRRGFRATFAFPSAWTLPMVPLSGWFYDTGPAGMVTAIIMVSVSMALSITMYAARLIDMVLVLSIAILGARFPGYRSMTSRCLHRASRGPAREPRELQALRSPSRAPRREGRVPPRESRSSWPDPCDRSVALCPNPASP